MRIKLFDIVPVCCLCLMLFACHGPDEFVADGSVDVQDAPEVDALADAQVFLDASVDELENTARSGTRIKVILATTEDGATGAIGFYDTLLGVECTLGPTGCIPETMVAIFYEDALCANPIAPWRTACIDPPPPWITHDRDAICLPPLIYERGQEVTPLQLYLLRPDGSCFSVAGPSPFTTYYEIGPIVMGIFATATTTME